MEKIMYKGSLCVPVFIAVGCCLWSAYNKCIENYSIDIANELVVSVSMYGLLFVTYIILFRLLMTDDEEQHGPNPRITRKEGVFWNKTVVLSFCVMMLNLAIMMYETQMEMDGYRKCFLCLVLALPLVLILFIDRSSYELHDSMMVSRSRPDAFLKILGAVMVVSFLMKHSKTSGAYSYTNLRNGEWIGWLALVWLICILLLGLRRKVNDDASSDVYVSDIIPLPQGPDF